MTSSTMRDSAFTSSPAVRAGQVVYPPSKCCSAGGMYPLAPFARLILNVSGNGLAAFNFNPVRPYTSHGMAVMPSSPIRTACSGTVSSGLSRIQTACSA